jgi:shikimate dehydrogenase
MQNAAFDALGLNWRYLPLPVAPGQAQAAVQGLGALGFRGANVTTPHKQAVMPALGSITSQARDLNAVNTLVVRWEGDGMPGIDGHNTDVEGFVSALRGGGFDPEEGGRAVVVGAGGGARAVVYGLLSQGMAQVTVLNRTLERAQALCSDLRQIEGWSSRVQPLPLTEEALIETARTAELLVNATAVGMWPHVAASIWPDGVPVPAGLTVFDLVYNPLNTGLLQQARACGAHAIDGLGMLVHQGALAFELWTGQAPPVSLMYAAAEEALA